jgi:UDP-glucose 4-epimerase
MLIKNQTILITGGAGYIGSHTAVQILNAGANVILFDNLCNSKRQVVYRIEKITGRAPQFVLGDIRDRIVLRNLFAANNIDAVIHFAGLKAVGESVATPLKYYDNNVSGSSMLFEEMSRAGVKTLIFSSSATVYGNPASVPIREEFPCSAMNPYARSKIIIEDILEDIRRSDPAWAIACLRYFNPIGAHKSGLIGEDPRGIPNNLMPLVAQVAAGARKDIEIFGGDYPTPDGTGIRDYIHVDDLAAGHIEALKVLEQSNFLKVNLGTGRGYSVLEMIKAFEFFSGKKIPFKISERRPGDIATCYADPGLAKKLLGWESKFGIEQMCQDIWRWQSMNPNGFQD